MLSTNKHYISSFSQIFSAIFSPHRHSLNPLLSLRSSTILAKTLSILPSPHTMQFPNDRTLQNNNKHFKKPRNITKTKKSGDKYFFFSCCKPDDVSMSFSAVTPGRREDDVVVKCAKMEEKDGIVFQTSVPAKVSSPEKDQYGGGRHRKKDHKKIITRVLKAVLFETALAKKIKKRKLIQKLHKSNAKLAAKLERGLRPKKRSRTFSNCEEIVKKVDTKNDINKRTRVHPLKSSDPSSVFSDPRTISARSFDSKPVDSKPKPDNYIMEEQGRLRRGRGMYSCNNGLCLILLSLLILVIWGKACAIVCTSTWLFLVPRLGSWNKSFPFMDNSKKIDSEEYKKKIILEGLLQRNPNRGP